MSRRILAIAGCVLTIALGAVATPLAQSNPVLGAPTSVSPDDDRWKDVTVLTIAPNGTWGLATEPSINRAIVNAINHCKSKYHGRIGCGHRFTTIRGGWSLGYRCGTQSIIVAEKSLADAQERALGREHELRAQYVPNMPACVRTVTVDPLGAVVAKHEEAALPSRSSPASGSDELLAASKAFEFGDYSTAHAIWLRLAEQGNAKSQASLAYLYRDGRGVRRDSETAAHWYYRAAIQGDPTAQSFLCEMHLRGEAVQRSLELALMWCELSIERGETRGIWHREEALNQMTTQERDSAWALVVKWRQIQSRGRGQPDAPAK
jgi:hypothetical protein